MSVTLNAMGVSVWGRGGWGGGEEGREEEWRSHGEVKGRCLKPLRSTSASTSSRVRKNPLSTLIFGGGGGIPAGLAYE